MAVTLEPDEEKGPGPVYRKALVWGVRGFSCAFWGLPLGLLLYFGAVDIQVMARFRIPTYLLGATVVLAGLIMLVIAGLPGPRWRSLSRQGLGACLLVIYEGPIAYWYNFMTQVGFYYLLNMMVMVTAIVWVFYAVNALAAELGKIDGDAAFAIEARLSAWGAVALMFVPLAAALGYSVTMAMKYDSTPLSEFRAVQESLPIWVTFCFVIPLSLTMASAWKAKERCLEILSRT